MIMLCYITHMMLCYKTHDNVTLYNRCYVMSSNTC